MKKIMIFILFCCVSIIGVTSSNVNAMGIGTISEMDNGFPGASSIKIINSGLSARVLHDNPNDNIGGLYLGTACNDSKYFEVWFTVPTDGIFDPDTDTNVVLKEICTNNYYTFKDLEINPDYFLYGEIIYDFNAETSDEFYDSEIDFSTSIYEKFVNHDYQIFEYKNNSRITKVYESQGYPSLNTDNLIAEYYYAFFSKDGNKLLLSKGNGLTDEFGFYIIADNTYNDEGLKPTYWNSMSIQSVLFTNIFTTEFETENELNSSENSVPNNIILIRPRWNN